MSQTSIRVMAKQTFMSPDVYRELIKPFDKRIVDAVKARGVLFQRHCCGKCEDLLEDFVETGVRLWHSAQPMNDISGLLDKYRGRLAIEGGWDSSGPASYLWADEEMIREEVRRCMTEYKKPGFILMPTLLNERGNSLFVGDERLTSLEDEWRKHRCF